MSQTLDEALDALPPERRSRIEARTQELLAMTAPTTPLAAVVEALREVYLIGLSNEQHPGYEHAARALLAKLAATGDEREPAHGIVPRNGCCALCGAPVDRTRLYAPPAPTAPGPAGAEACRQAFEKWISDEGIPRPLNNHWLAWQAAWDVALEQPR